MCAKENECDSGKPKSANPLSWSKMRSRVGASMPRWAIPAIRSPLRASMRSGLRLDPMARRSWSARAPDRPAASVAMRMSCSWKSGTPRVWRSAGSSSGCR